VPGATWKSEQKPILLGVNRFFAMKRGLSWEAFKPAVWPTLRELQLSSCHRFGSKPAFGSFEEGKLTWKTYAEFGERVEMLKQTLIAECGVKKGGGKEGGLIGFFFFCFFVFFIYLGDRVSVISKNSLDWATSAYSTYAAG
jgi:hypothetical protein